MYLFVLLGKFVRNVTANAVIVTIILQKGEVMKKLLSSKNLLALVIIKSRITKTSEITLLITLSKLLIIQV